MAKAKQDISIVITGHGEGRLSVASLRSFRIAADFARAQGYTVQEIYVLDRANVPTTQSFSHFAELAGADGLLLETDLGDQGAARNAAIKKATGVATAFLDGDDLFTDDWLVRAYEFLKDAGQNVVAHPQFNYFFEGQKSVFEHIDQDSPDFSMDVLRVVNYWDALAMAYTKLYKQFPFYDRDMKNGWAYEDWAWNCALIDAGVRHKVVPETVIFKRRRATSQTMQASTGRARMRRTPILSYSHAIYSDI